MKIIICDNCGGEGRESYGGDLCEPCNAQYLEKRKNNQAAIDLMEYELKKEFHIRK